MTSVAPSSYAKGHNLPALQIVLVGGRELGGIEASGKTCSGNTILGKDDSPVRKRTSISVKSEGRRFGRHVTVVDTPGWWWHFSLEDTPKHDQIEFVNGAALCSPGPHAFLLVIPVDMGFPEVYRFSLEEHLGRLKGNVWQYTIVLFSSNGPHQKDVFEKHLKQWPDLQWVIKKCQNRYHILDNKNKSDESQILELFNKIEKLVAMNGGQCYESGENALHLEQWRSIVKEAAEERIKAVETQRALLNEDIRDDQLGEERRIAIVGAQYAARSSSGNTILGREAFVEGSKRTVRCTMQKGKVAGRHVTVVDTPGWFYNSPSCATAAMDKLEMKLGVSLCAPGPHAVILTVPFATAFNKSYCQAVKEHMMLFGEDVWRYTIVLFTRGDWLGDTTPEERIESEGEDLKWLIEKCGNRYHTFNNKNRDDQTQVKELLKKIDEMVASNSGCCYEMDRDVAMENAEKKMLTEENAEKLLGNTTKIRAVLKKLYKGQKHSFSEQTLVLLGAREAGKSTAGNTILMGFAFRSGLTKAFKNRRGTTKCLPCQRRILKKNVTVVDTPGWSTSTDDASVLVEEEIARGVSMCLPGPHGFLLVIPANKPFTEEDKKATTKYMNIIGESAWRHTVLVFTCGDWLGNKSVEEYIESEGDNLKWLVEKCGNRYHLLNNFVDTTESQLSQVRKLLEKIDEMIVRNREKVFCPVAKQSSPFNWFRKKTFTEDEWLKREDDLVERMLRAVVEEPEKKPVEARDGSIVISIPNMNEETPSEFEMSVSRGPPIVAWWRSRFLNFAASSGYDTMSTAQSVRGADGMSELEYSMAEQSDQQKLLNVPNKSFIRNYIALGSPLKIMSRMNPLRRNSL
ncbi:GTPase IMAP family member 8-like [Alosa sapidissima]|uniref:GTPase IMAP family member 8-like n=1 Tax=Alosa sapidissima TaxID=34773 RepID=UPI001C0941B0|nr:GTPase IMAP family member 8-like [Alosa sapidissima]